MKRSRIKNGYGNKIEFIDVLLKTAKRFAARKYIHYLHSLHRRWLNSPYQRKKMEELKNGQKTMDLIIELDLIAIEYPCFDAITVL